VFAVEDTCVQLTWSAMGPERCVIGVGPQARTVRASPPAWLHQRGLPSRRLSRLPGGPGAVVIDGLAPGVTYDVWVAPAVGPGPGATREDTGPEVPSSARQVVAQVTTLTPPPGRLLCRFASVSDVHIGDRRFGWGGRIREGSELGGPSARLCLEAAVAEATAWGAELMAARGDLTHNSAAEQFDLAARTLTGTGLPAVGVLGNHDVRRRANGVALSAPGGLVVTDDVAYHDLPGIRLVLAHSPLVTNHRGDLPPARIARIAELCGEAPPTSAAAPARGASAGSATARAVTAGPATADGPGMAAVILHHPLNRRSQWLSAYPPGVPEDQSARLTAALLEANPSTVVLAGHRHRNRKYQVGGITMAEVGSTKDYPGSWAGYAVYEGGIRQVIRRVAAPPALAWTEATGRSLGGQWARWTPGRLDDRCWVAAW
jgi:3',5'-cyclic-AMP phosphodiesterase